MGRQQQPARRVMRVLAELREREREREDPRSHRARAALGSMLSIDFGDSGARAAESCGGIYMARPMATWRGEKG